MRLLIPHDAVRDESGQQVVFLYKEGHVERRAVRMGGAIGNDQEVIAGLSAGDQVVVSGFDGLRDGQRVGIKSR